MTAPIQPEPLITGPDTIKLGLGTRLAYYLWSKLAPSPVATVGLKPPWFELLDLYGKLHTPQRHWDKVIVLKFCTLWCAPCRWEQDGWSHLFRTYRDQGLMVLGCYPSTTQSELIKHTNDFKIEHPVATVGSKICWDYTLFPSGKLPVSVCINRQGYVAAIWRGYHPANWYEEAIKPLLRQK